MNEGHLTTIRRYYDGCNRGDVKLMISTFAPNVVHYFTGYPPVRGAAELANHWANFQKGGRTTYWTVDHAIAEGDEAVIEWTMRSYSSGDSHPTILRGTEWYVFKDGKIAEIRAYYHWAHGVEESELDGFPYGARRYPTLGVG